MFCARVRRAHKHATPTYLHEQYVLHTRWIEGCLKTFAPPHRCRANGDTSKGKPKEESKPFQKEAITTQPLLLVNIRLRDANIRLPKPPEPGNEVQRDNLSAPARPRSRDHQTTAHPPTSRWDQRHLNVSATLSYGSPGILSPSLAKGHHDPFPMRELRFTPVDTVLSQQTLVIAVPRDE